MPSHAINFEQAYDAIIKGFVGALLLGSHPSESLSLWPLPVQRCTSDLPARREIQDLRQTLTEPLAGSPSSILAKIKLLNEASDWHRVNRVLRSSLTADQRYVMRLLDEELMV